MGQHAIVLHAGYIGKSKIYDTKLKEIIKTEQ